MAKLLIIEDDAAFARRLSRNLGLDGFTAEVADGPEDGLRRLATEGFDAVLCDIKMPGMSGLEL
ncbi:response regulator [Candidatus Poribacteria bacterium]|nr:response regulator [Candidatus Poribacteria bacterium]